MAEDMQNDNQPEVNGEIEQATSEPQAVTEQKKPKKKKEVERNDPTTLHERTIATLSYFGPFAIIPFYLKKDSEFCRFHGKQGMLVALMFFIAKIFTVLGFIMDLLLVLQAIILFRMGMAALSGRWKKMPFFYEAACQLEKSLTLKTKEEEMQFEGLQPNQTTNETSESQVNPQ